MIEETSTIARLETWQPRPIARSLKKYRDLPQSSGAFEQVDALTKVAEVEIKLLAAICAKNYLLDGGRDSGFQKEVDNLGNMSLGHWCALLRLSLAPYEKRTREEPISHLYDAYSFSWGAHDSVRDAIAIITDGSQGAVHRTGGKLTTASLLDVLVSLRNFIAHGAKLSNDEWELMLPSIELLIRIVLDAFQLFKHFNLFSVEEVKVEKLDSENQFVHEGWSSSGTQLERVQLFAADALQNKRLYLVRHDEASNLNYAIDLSPFWISQSCPECHQELSFVLNSIKGKRINYLSYQCGHRLELQDIGAEITDIKAFLEGKISIDRLFSGKVIGQSAERLAMGPSSAERKQVAALLKEVRESLEAGLYVETITILEHALTIDQDGAYLHYLRAFSKLLANTNLEDVILELKQAVRLNPDSHEANYLLAQTYLGLKAPSHAKQSIESALRADPTNELYRDLEKDLAEVSEDTGNEQFLIELDSKARQNLNTIVAENLRLGKKARIQLCNWTANLPPFSWIAAAPLIRSAIVAGTLFLIVILLQGQSLNNRVVAEQMSIAWNNWILMYVSFLGVEFVMQLYGRLRSVFPIPRETFKRFFVRQCSLMFGKTCLVEDQSRSSGILETIKTDWLFASIAAGGFLLLLPIQYACADDPFNFTVATMARYFTYIFQALVFCWVIPLSLLCLRFAPGFYRLPQRFFPDMPDSVSLRPLADVYVGFSMLAAIAVPGFLVQHFIFDTVSNAPIAHWTYFVVATVLLICIFGISQLIVKFTLEKLRDKTLTRFSFEVEAAFEEFLRQPGENSFERLEKAKIYMASLSDISTKSLSRRGKFGLLVSILLVSSSSALYFWAVWDKLWFVM